MNYEFLVARKIIFGKKKENRFSAPIIRLAVLSVGLGLAVMIVAVMIVTGFKNEISNKVIGFGTHIRINRFDMNNSYEESPIEKLQPFLKVLASDKDVRHVQVYATKAGIVKTETELQGVLLKGVGSDFGREFFKDKITEGEFFTVTDTSKSNDVLISKKISSLLNLKLNDDLVIYFIQQPPRVRKFKITGIYETGMEEFDNLYVLCDIAQIQKLNEWTTTQVAGFEVLLKDFKKLDQVAPRIYKEVGYEFDIRTIKDLFPQIFNWLDLQNINVLVILTLMILIASINMISTLLIIILENTNMIGTLKALGAENISIQKIFIYISSFIIGYGLLAGNIIAITLCLLQKNFGFFKLPQESYYVSVVPVNFSIPYLLLLNAGSIIICLLFLIIPSFVISKIQPAKAIRFD